MFDLVNVINLDSIEDELNKIGKRKIKEVDLINKFFELKKFNTTLKSLSIEKNKAIKKDCFCIITNDNKEICFPNTNDCFIYLMTHYQPFF